MPHTLTYSGCKNLWERWEGPWIISFGFLLDGDIVDFKNKVENFKNLFLYASANHYLWKIESGTDHRIMFLTVRMIQMSGLETWNFHQTQTRPRLDQNQKKNLVRLELVQELYGLTWNLTLTYTCARDLKFSPDPDQTKTWPKPEEKNWFNLNLFLYFMVWLET